MNPIIIAHDKLIEHGGAEVVLKILVDILKPEYVIVTVIKDKIEWEKYLGVKIISPCAFRFIRTDFLFRLTYPAICFFSRFIRYNLHNSDLFLYSSTAAKHLAFYNYKKRLFYSNFPLKVFRDKAKYLSGKDNILKNKILSLYLFLSWKVELFSMSKFSKIFVISQDAKKAYLEYYPNTFQNSDIEVIYLPVERSMVTPIKRNFSNNDTVHFLLITRLYSEKSLVPFLDQFVRQLGRHSLRVIGAGPLLGVMREKYSDSNVNFLGFTDEETKEEELKAADALIFPTKQEWSMTVIEANIRGLLCFMVDCPASREINTIISGSLERPNIIYDDHINTETLIADLNQGYRQIIEYHKEIKTHFSPERFAEDLRTILK